MSFRSLTASCLLLCAVSSVFAYPSEQIPLGLSTSQYGKSSAESGLCPQATPLFPSKGSAAFDTVLSKLYKDEAFQLGAFEALGRAVRVP